MSVTIGSHKYPRPEVPVLKLHGTSYQIGFQQGELAKAQIDANVRTYTAFFRETANLTWHEAKERATSFIPTLQKIYPGILEEIQGIADGAKLTLEDILAINVRSEIALTNYVDIPSKAPPKITDGCTSLAQLSNDGKTLIAQNWDWLEELHDGIVFLHITTKSGTVMQFLNEAGLVGKIGLNSHGFGLCNNALRSGAKDISRLPTHIMSRRLLEYSKSYDEAVQMLKDYSGACTCNYVLADSTGRIGDVEVSPRGLVEIKPLSKLDAASILTPSTKNLSGQGPSFVAHTNHVISPPTSFPLGPIYDHPAPNSFDRLARVSLLTQRDIEKHVALTKESVIERLKDQEGTPYSICRDRPAGAKGMEKMTTLATIVMELGPGRWSGLVTIGRPCEDGLQMVEWVF